MNLEELVRESYETAKNKGWHGGPERSFAALTLLMQSEIAEALEDYRANKGLSEVWFIHKMADGSTVTNTESELDGIPGKPCGIPIELADFLIRVFDFCGRYEVGLREVPISTWSDFETVLAMVNWNVSVAFKALYDEGKPPSKEPLVWMNLSEAVQSVVAMCRANDIDIDEALKVKMIYNKTRPARHGGEENLA